MKRKPNKRVTDVVVEARKALKTIRSAADRELRMGCLSLAVGLGGMVPDGSVAIREAQKLYDWAMGKDVPRKPQLVVENPKPAR